VESHEVTFEGVSLERDGTLLRYRGIIDRIEVGHDDRAPGRYVAAVDYKTSKYAAPAAGKKEAWDDGVVLQVPLYAHALAQLRPGWQVARVEYRALKHAERLHLLNLVRVRKGVAEQDGEATARMEASLTAAVRHVQSVREGTFPAAPAPSCHCPPFCHGWDICRVAGGPDDGWE
jgi:RecB family exonuclease